MKKLSTFLNYVFKIILIFAYTSLILYYFSSSGESRINKSHTYSSVKSLKPKARCKDGSYSYSPNRSGTCSRHGGVEKWL
jgi:hypothetical protein